jgi:hypothetical protein
MVPLIHANLTVFSAGVYELMVGRREGDWPYPDFERMVIFNRTQSQGFAFSVRSKGDYTIRFDSPSGGIVGYLTHNGNRSFNVTTDGDKNFPVVEYLLLPTLSPSPVFDVRRMPVHIYGVYGFLFPFAVK